MILSFRINLFEPEEIIHEPEPESKIYFQATLLSSIQYLVTFQESKALCKSKHCKVNLDLCHQNLYQTEHGLAYVRGVILGEILRSS